MFTEYSIDGYWIILFILVVLLIRLAWESYHHYKQLYSIKYRVHVNGSRGKSSVTRLIASGLREGGLKTVAKTTGTLARYIDHDGREENVYRIGRTNVIEQIKIVRKAAKCKPDVLVIECMAVHPLLQSLCELQIVRSTHGVCTNVRADHLDVMGPEEEDVALALAGTMPVKGQFFTAERRFLNTFAMAAEDRESSMLGITEESRDSVSDEAVKNFSYAEHKDNIALALAVCESLGVDHDTALKGMWQATPDPGALTINRITYQDTQITFANGFAANDPVSTGELWQKIITEYPEYDDLYVFVNCRQDRGDRSAQMAEAIVTWEKPKYCLVIGSGSEFFLKNLDKRRFEEVAITNGEGWDVEQVLDHVAKLSPGKKVLVVGVCNIAKIGFALLKYFEETEKKQS